MNTFLQYIKRFALGTYYGLRQYFVQYFLFSIMAWMFMWDLGKFNMLGFALALCFFSYTMFFYWFNRAQWPENLYRELFWRDTGEGTQMPRDFLASLEYVLMTGMTEREALAVRCRYQYRETYVQIGQKLGVQQERIRQILIKCIHKLRHPSRARLLRYGIAEYICQYGDKCKEAAYEEG